MPDPAPPADPVAVVSVTTRFLYPFYFDRDSVPAAVTQLKKAAFAGGDPHWRDGAPHEQYADEFFEHVTDYLFGKGAPGRCAYLEAGPAAARWLAGGLDLEPWPGQKPLRAGLPPAGEARTDDDRERVFNPPPAVELFLTAQGVGVLSVTLAATTPSPDGLTTEDAVRFNYRLAQFRHGQAAALLKGKPTAPATPGEKGTLPGHLAGPDGRFYLQEAMNLLTAPLELLHRRPVQPRELCAYTVVRLSGADFGDAGRRAALAAALSALAQVEPEDAAGAPPGEVTVPAVVLNRCHWAAVGVLGAAHLVIDQPDRDGCPVAFNVIRPRLALNKYFVSYLLALIQQHTLHRSVDEAVRVLALTATRERLDRTRALKADLLRFGVGGQFNQVSGRHTQHRFYQVARDGLDVRRGWDDVTRAVADLDADLAARQREDTEARQNHLSARVEQSVAEIMNVQRVVHVIEFLLAAVYLAHFWHMLTHGNRWLQHLFGASDHGWEVVVTAGMFVAAGVGMGLVGVANAALTRRHERAAARAAAQQGGGS